jgi:hypothetical protein
MLASSIWWILVISGIFTALGGLNAFVVPASFLGTSFGVDRAEPATLFFARHWGILVAVVGALVVWSAYVPALRQPVLIAAAVEKLALVVMVFFGPLKRTVPMTAVASMDGLFTILYVIYLVAD